MGQMTMFEMAEHDWERLAVRDWPATERPSYRLEQYGAAMLSNVELLCLATGSRYMEEAATLLRNAGGLAKLSTKTKRELEALGLTPKRAEMLQAVFELGRRARMEVNDRQKVYSPGDAAQYLMPQMAHLDREEIVVLLLNTRGEIVRSEIIYRGTVSEIQVRVAEVLKPAVANNIPSIIMAHNHPSGDPEPSPQDIALSRQLVKGGELLGVNVLDHIIIGHNKWVSLKSRGEM